MTNKHKKYQSSDFRKLISAIANDMTIAGAAKSIGRTPEGVLVTLNKLRSGYKDIRKKLNSGMTEDQVYNSIFGEPSNAPVQSQYSACPLSNCMFMLCQLTEIPGGIERAELAIKNVLSK